MTKLSKKGEERRLEKAKETEELHKFFQQLWDRMPKKKSCKSCGAPIWGDVKTYYFDHLLEKGKYSELALLEWNVFFCCQKCHGLKTNGFPTKEHSKAIERAQEEYKLYKEGLLMYEKMLKS